MLKDFYIILKYKWKHNNPSNKIATIEIKGINTYKNIQLVVSISVLSYKSEFEKAPEKIINPHIVKTICIINELINPIKNL